MYKDFPSINDDDDLKALEDDYLHEMSIHRTETKPLGKILCKDSSNFCITPLCFYDFIYKYVFIDIFHAVRQLSNKTKMCKRTKVLVDSYEKISDHVVMSLREPSLGSDRVGIDQIAEKIKGIKEEATKKCEKFYII